MAKFSKGDTFSSSLKQEVLKIIGVTQKDGLIDIWSEERGLVDFYQMEVVESQFGMLNQAPDVECSVFESFVENEIYTLIEKDKE